MKTKPCITVEDLQSKIIAEDPILILDVRTQEEFEKRHIAEAIHLPLEKLMATTLDLIIDTSIVTVCEKGAGRSEKAAQMILDAGISAIYLCGGTEGWFNQNKKQ